MAVSLTCSVRFWCSPDRSFASFKTELIYNPRRLKDIDGAMMSISLRRLGYTAIFLAAFNSTSHAADEYEGWWVVLATYPRDPDSYATVDVGVVEDQAHRCGIKVFSDLSGKFRGFAGGYVVFVQAGNPHLRREDALIALKPVKRCFNDAYVKYGRYLGE